MMGAAENTSLRFIDLGEKTVVMAFPLVLAEGFAIRGLASRSPKRLRTIKILFFFIFFHSIW